MPFRRTGNALLFHLSSAYSISFTFSVGSPSALAAAVALVFLAGVAARLAVVLAVAVVAFVRVGGKPVAGVGPGGVDGRGRARGDGERAASVVFDAGGGGGRDGARPSRGGGRRWNAVAELLGRDGIETGPEAATSGAGGGFGLRVGRRGVKALVVPGVARLEHFEVDFFSVGVDRSEDAIVFVTLAPRYAHLFSRDETGEVASGGIAVGLVLFWRVNPLEANLVLRFGRVKDGDRIAVGHLHDTADEVGRRQTDGRLAVARRDQ